LERIEEGMGLRRSNKKDAEERNLFSDLSELVDSVQSISDYLDSKYPLS